MVNRVYKIRYSKSSLELNDDYDNLSDYEKEQISELDAEGFLDYEDNNIYCCYVISTPVEVVKYSKILTNNLIQHEYLDLSQEILNNKIDIEIELEHKLDEKNLFKYDFFLDDLEHWIYNNLEIDIVLDRITDVGINSLKQVEKDFLKHYSI
jgi:hypothetical protein